MKYDDASWHYGGDFPSDLPNDAGYTHIAMFLAWAVLNGLGSDYQSISCDTDLARLRSRIAHPVGWFAAVSDGKFTDQDLNTEGNAFARTYYGGSDGLNTRTGGFVDDYTRCLPNLPSLYHVPADWENYDRIAPIFSRRLRTWRWRRKLMQMIRR